MRTLTTHIILLFFVTTVRAAQPVHLQCEQLNDPQGIDALHPRLSWQLTGNEKDLHQTAYQLLVASSPELLAKDKGDLWSTAKIPGDQSRMIPYAGRPLKTGIPCYWKVRVWTTTGPTDWSTPAHWSMGLL